MLSNPPYGKNWNSDLNRMGGKNNLNDARFLIEHAGNSEYSLVTRSSDGQMLFLANMLSKMKLNTQLGSRIAEVHNGSSLFTGDAGQGESNIRRWIIENDWLEAIVALPINMFYNTGIATYIWVLTNRKPAHRKGKVQLIDATQWFQPLRKNLGKKNCELGESDIKQICATSNKFRYWKRVALMFLKREVLPHAPDAWCVGTNVKIGYEISFTRYFYKPQPMRTLDEIRADILALEKETDGLLSEIMGK